MLSSLPSPLLSLEEGEEVGDAAVGHSAVDDKAHGDAFESRRTGVVSQNAPRGVLGILFIHVFPIVATVIVAGGVERGVVYENDTLLVADGAFVAFAPGGDDNVALIALYVDNHAGEGDFIAVQHPKPFALDVVDVGDAGGVHVHIRCPCLVGVAVAFNGFDKHDIAVVDHPRLKDSDILQGLGLFPFGELVVPLSVEYGFAMDIFAYIVAFSGSACGEGQRVVGIAVRTLLLVKVGGENAVLVVFVQL